jgi:predicted NAD/FAD-dependent oxidoreductase
VQLSDGCFSFVADNLVKGVSPVPIVTLHATGDVSRRLWDSPDEVVVERLLAEGIRWLGSGVVDARLVRWPYARPTGLFESPCLALDRPAPVVFAGDAFGEARVEGATLSGLAAAAAILSMVAGGG